MILFTLFLAILATLGAQHNLQVNPRLDKTTGGPNWQIRRPTTPSKAVDTVIENKNVNIIVNVDPKDVAKELWSLIETRLEGRAATRRSMRHNSAVEELEKIVRPMVAAPSRRSNPPSAFEVAYALDHVTRRALLGGDRPRAPTIDDEIDTRQIVARMMLKLKFMMKSDRARSTSALPTMYKNVEEDNFRRSMNDEDENSTGNDADFYEEWEKEKEEPETPRRDDDIVRIVLNLRKRSILKGNVVYSDKDP